MLRFWGHPVRDVILPRSPPHHKNDNPRVEPKNYTLVRRYLGYDCLWETDTVTMAHREQLEALRDGIKCHRLRHQIHLELDDVLRLPYTAPGSSQNVHLTLDNNLDRRR